MKLLRHQTPDGPAFGSLKHDGTVNSVHGAPFSDYTVGPTIGQFEELQLLAPVVPGKIIAVGLNYRAHAAEVNMEIPTFPMLFYKPPSSVIGPGESIVLPRSSEQVEHECELALVIGRKTRNVSQEEALDYLIGYTAANDVSARDWQARESQWVRAKSFDTFLPLGPIIVSDLNPDDLNVATRVNGQTTQDSNTADMIFSVAFLIQEISQVMTLEPGDVIITGTPQGVGPITKGDTVEIEGEGVGVLSNPAVAES